MADEQSAVVLTGIKETLDSLKEFDKDAVRRFNKVVSTELGTAERAAHDLVDKIQSRTTDTPMRNWKPYDVSNGRSRGGKGWPGFDKSVIKQNIKKTRVQGKVRRDYTTSAGALLNKSAAGVIFEVAGRRSNKGSFIERLNWFGKASRLVWKVVDQQRARIEKAVVDALEEAKQELQKNLDKAAGKAE
jgi:hypothetical protein